MFIDRFISVPPLYLRVLRAVPDDSTSTNRAPFQRSTIAGVPTGALRSRGRPAKLQGGERRGRDAFACRH
jgi:hypothetical protein